MSILADDSAVMTRTKELCEAIASDPEYKALMKSVESFLDDDAARLQYQSVHEKGEELNQKQGSGLELSDSEVQAFESAREALFSNPVAKAFLDAQNDLHSVQSAIGKYVGMTLELGRVPGPEDFQKDGCCGGEGGGGG
jgi:cell fate (sporulation/competence/biofilm development) regulator YlbF (YheA/YmcA/DUF963 family)